MARSYWYRAYLFVTSLVVLAQACAPAGAGTASDGPASARADTAFDAADGDVTEFEHKWAIDLDKVRESRSYRGWGETTEAFKKNTRFFGIAAGELLNGAACPSPEELTAIYEGGPEMVMGVLEQNPDAAACLVSSKPELVFSDDGQFQGLGGSFAWGNMQTLEFDHTKHVDFDPREPSRAKPILNLTETRGGERVFLDPPGYLNVIAMYNAERHEQTEIRKYLRNGDVMVYVHPEERDARFQFTAHHAAMFYDTGEGPVAISLSGKPFVHHLDNPTSYGPAFTGGQSSTPFHVFRFNPNSQGGAVTGGPRDGSGRYKFPCNDVAEQMLGCEGEGRDRYFTIDDEMAQRYAYMARNWAFITNMVAPFADFQTLTLRDLKSREHGLRDNFAVPAIGGREMNELYCAGLVYANLSLGLNYPFNREALDFWKDGLYATFEQSSYYIDDRYLDAQLTPAELAKGGEGLPPLGVMPIEPIMPSDIVINWLERYFPGFDTAGLPEQQAAMLHGVTSQARAGVITQIRDQIADEFSVVDWDGDSQKRQEALAQNGRDLPPVIDADKVAQYAMAYGKQLEDDGVAFREMRAAEKDAVENRYMYPPIYHVVSNNPDSLFSYVGTVIPSDLLTALDGDDGGAGSGTSAEYAQGGPDSSRYPHYFLPNGGLHTQRVFEVDSGPRVLGKGSEIMTRISATNIEDIRVVLHPAGTFPRLESLYACDRAPQDQPCLPIEGDDGPAAIFLPLNDKVDGFETSTKWEDVRVTWDLFKSVEDGGVGCRIVDDATECPGYDWEDHVSSGLVEIADTYGQWTLTVLDLGLFDDDRVGYCLDSSTGAQTDCPKGGAHTNQWMLKIRNDEGGGASTGTYPWDANEPNGCDLDGETSGQSAGSAGSAELGLGTYYGRACESDRDWYLIKSPVSVDELDLTATIEVVAGDENAALYVLVAQTDDAIRTNGGDPEDYPKVPGNTDYRTVHKVDGERRVEVGGVRGDYRLMIRTTGFANPPPTYRVVIGEGGNG